MVRVGAKGLLGGAVLCLALFTGGCSHQRAEKAETPPRKVIGHSVHGRPIEAVTIGNGPEHVFIGATIHGNEWAGTPIVEKLIDYLPGRKDILGSRTVTIVPVINPDGYHFKTRGNAHGVDLNRNFPAENRENSRRYGMSAFSEPESKILYDIIEETSPTRIVIIHQPLDKVDWDGPARPLAQHMARHTHLPEDRIGARPGSMGSHYGVDKNIPIITYELPRHAERESTSTLWDQYGRALLASITYPEPVSRAAFSPVSLSTLLAPVVILVVSLLVLFVVDWFFTRRRRVENRLE